MAGGGRWRATRFSIARGFARAPAGGTPWRNSRTRRRRRRPRRRGGGSRPRPRGAARWLPSCSQDLAAEPGSRRSRNAALFQSRRARLGLCVRAERLDDALRGPSRRDPKTRGCGESGSTETSARSRPDRARRREPGQEEPAAETISKTGLSTLVGARRPGLRVLQMTPAFDGFGTLSRLTSHITKNPPTDRGSADHESPATRDR